MTLRLSLANENDLDVIIGLVEEAALWLRSKGTDQWARPWPSRKARDQRIWTDLSAQKTWVAWNGDAAAATITMEDSPDEKLRHDWDSEPATYVHRLVVSRSHAGLGLGGALLNWTGRRSAWCHGANWIRIDVWTTNYALHRYYERQGFKFVRYCSDAEYPSGALFQKATALISGVNGHLPDEEIPSHRIVAETHQRRIRVPLPRAHTEQLGHRRLHRAELFDRP